MTHDLKEMSDQDLHQKMLLTSQEERALTAQMISMIEEVARRKFYLDLGFPSLFRYLTDGLKYSAGSAMRRISAARIAEEVPEVKERLLEGSLSLSNLSQVEQFFRNEQKYHQPLDTEQKREVLKQVENLSSRDAEKVLLKLSSVPEHLIQEDKVKPITPELTQITFKANAEFMAQLEEVRGLLAHQMPHATLSEIMAQVMDVAAAGLRKKKFRVRDASPKVPSKASPGSASAKRSKVQDEVKTVAQAPEMSETPSEGVSTSDVGSSENRSRVIAASVRRAVFQRDQERCAVINPRTGKRCGSRWKLELDHYPLPWAMGGASTVSNLRLACAACNRLHALASYGKEKVLNRV